MPSPPWPRARFHARMDAAHCDHVCLVEEHTIKFSAACFRATWTVVQMVWMLSVASPSVKFCGQLPFIPCSSHTEGGNYFTW
eukprot:1172364-Amphidinium_carterae.1